MALLNDDALESGENVYKIASERSERADFLNINSSKKVLQFKFDLLYITLYSVFSTKICIIRKLV